MSSSDIRKSLNILNESVNEGAKNSNKVLTRLQGVESRDFWEVVAAIGWGTLTTDYDDIQAALYKKYSPVQVASLEKKAGAYREHLTKAINRYEKKHGIDNFFNESDDGWWDVTAHIVGLGQKIFRAGVQNPATLKGMEDKAVENFQYSFGEL